MLMTSFSLQVAASLLVGALLAFGVGGCTPSDTPEAPTAEQEDSAVRLPSLRLPGRSAEPVETLMADRADDTVAVVGTVTQRAAVLDGWLYQIQDDTGSLWVLSDRTEPVVGAQATVQGILRYEAIVVGEIDAGDVYLEETSYRQSAE